MPGGRHDEKELKLDAYVPLYPSHAQSTPFIARRYCALWGRGT